MKPEEKLSYMMMFCSMLLVRNFKATFQESIGILPLEGSAKHLAGELANPDLRTA